MALKICRAFINCQIKLEGSIVMYNIYWFSVKDMFFGQSRSLPNVTLTRLGNNQSLKFCTEKNLKQ